MDKLNRGGKLVKFIIRELEAEHLPGALKLVREGYEEEKKMVPFLPAYKELEESLQKKLKALADGGKGFVALRDGEVTGFLAGYPMDQLFGSCRGVYVPLFGQGAQKENRQEIYRELYTCAAEKWVEEGKYSHALTFFAQDRETIDTWFWLGFGLRCVDAIRKTEPLEATASGLEVKKGNFADLPMLASLDQKHSRYYRNSPVFMLKSCENPLQDLKEWLKRENHHLWYALQEGTPVGYLQVEPTGETFISHHPWVMNITGAFVADKTRGRGVGLALLAQAQNWLKEEGYPLCGVDFESINIAGSKFWNRYFTPYTFSLVRRIDERVGREKENA